MFKSLFGSGPAVPEVDVHEAWRRMQEENAVMLDVREPDEIRDAAVPGSIRIPLGQLGSKGGTLPHDRDILVFCRSGNRSAMATEMLQHNGFKRSSNVSGGIIAWDRDGLPIE